MSRDVRGTAAIDRSDPFNPERRMRCISYERTDFHGDPEPVTNDLTAFVYDVPHLGACGIFPPFHILNEVLASGGSEGGMGPGAAWAPFQITEDEYSELAGAIAATPLRELAGKARYGDVRFEFDPQFDGIPGRLQWMAAVCGKHLESYLARKKKG